MRKNIACLIFCVFICRAVYADQEKKADPNQLFYGANSVYEKGDYAKAIEQYLSVIDSGITSGNLLYNAGNAFFKSGKIGHAILHYKKAERMIPHDSDLKSNLGYARSVAADAAPESDPAGRLVRIAVYPLKDLGLVKVTLISVALYIVTALITAILILHPDLRRRFLASYVLILTVSLYGIFVFCARYYDEVVLVRGIVVEKDVDAKYEPIDKSTTYFKLGHGAGVVILKTKNGWRRIRRSDGKVAWVKEESVGQI